MSKYPTMSVNQFEEFTYEMAIETMISQTKYIFELLDKINKAKEIYENRNSIKYKKKRFMEDIMTLKELKIFDLVNYLIILDKQDIKICDIEFDDNGPCNRVSFINDTRTELEKYNQYKDYKILEIKDLDIDVNFENNYITVKIDL